MINKLFKDEFVRLSCVFFCQLEGVDVEAALEKYVAKGDWAKAISIAEKKVRTSEL